jgi:hypothetical protein
MRFAFLFLASAALVGRAHAQGFVPLLTFEGPDLVAPNDGGEGIGANAGGGVVSAVGATEGLSAFFFDNSPSANAVYFDLGTVNNNLADPNGGGHAERLANYNAIATASAAAEAGTPVFLEFDVRYDASAVTAAGFFQLGVFANSNNGFDGVWFGGLNQGNMGPGGDFPQAGSEAGAGVTFTVLDPADLVTDFVGALRFSVPVGLGKALELGSGNPPDGQFDFAQLGFNRNSGYTGTLDISFDRVGFRIVPEPGAAVLSLIAGVALFGRRRRRA